jgi:hypothetical protein
MAAWLGFSSEEAAAPRYMTRFIERCLLLRAAPKALEDEDEYELEQRIHLRLFGSKKGPFTGYNRGHGRTTPATALAIEMGAYNNRSCLPRP